MSELATYLADSLRLYAAVLPWFLPGVVVALVLGLPLSRPVARALGAPRAVAYLLAVSVGAILAATLPPGAGGFDRLAEHGGCHLQRFWLADAHAYLSVSEVSLNVLLFVPLGVALALLPRTTRASTVAIAALALPIAIEALQVVLTPFGRACESGDAVDNFIGLVIGLVIGGVLSVVVRLVRGSTEPEPPLR